MPWLDVTDALCSSFIRCQDKHNIQQGVTLYPFLVFLAWGLWKWFAIFKTNLSCFCSTLWMEKVKDSLCYLGWYFGLKMLPFLHSQFIGADFKSSFTHRTERDKQSHRVNKKGKTKPSFAVASNPTKGNLSKEEVTLARASGMLQPALGGRCRGGRAKPLPIRSLQVQSEIRDQRCWCSTLSPFSLFYSVWDPSLWHGATRT